MNTGYPQATARQRKKRARVRMWITLHGRAFQRYLDTLFPTRKLFRHAVTAVDESLLRNEVDRSR